MQTFKRSLAAVAVMGLLLSGCGSSDSEGEDTESETSSESSEAPEEEAPQEKGAFGTEDFSFDAPEGWEDVSDQVPNTVIAVANTQDDDGFADNVNATKVSAEGVDDLDTFEDQAKQGVSSVGGTDIEVRDRTEVDGEDAVHISSVLASGGTEYVTEQYGAINGDNAYIITFSYNTDVPQDERDQVSESILDTWQWAS